ncbi:hypothetical protein [uncultured Ruegeria sp.]|uniref:hypothetical protein n=1 Tax=uncultured Ruegeria sp. TaxID=259304 RepID=UPI0026035058|nr:hypothetical protein [uncultured Ruegeria sp.]
MTQNEESGGRKDLPSEILDLVKYILIGNPLRRFFTVVFLGGVSLIGGDYLWPLIIQAVTDASDQVINSSDSKGEEGTDWLTVRNSGLIICATGVFLHIIYFFYEQRAKKRLEENERRNKKAQLVGVLREIANGFHDSNISRGPGFMADDIRAAKVLAKALKPCLPDEIVSDRIFAVILDPKIDADAIFPYEGVEVNNLGKFAEKLAAI